MHLLRWVRGVLGRCARALFGEESPSAASAIVEATIDAERQRTAKRYARIRQRLMLVNLGIGAAALGGVLLSGVNFWLRQTLVGVGGALNWAPVAGWLPLRVAAFGAALSALFFILDVPLSIYSGYILPRRFGLSTQRFGAWLWDQAKGMALSLPIELGAIELGYLLLAVAPGTWWIWAAVALLVFAVLASNLAPVIFLPLFYKLTPLPEGDVRERALALAERARTKVRGIYRMNMSAKTTAANAMVIGLGNTRRIVIGDTLLDQYAPDEIEVVVAHELGHQVHNDIPKLIAFQTVVTVSGLYLTNLALHAVVSGVSAYSGLNDVAAMPLLGAALGIFGLVTLPLTNGYSRYVEHQADVYALTSTRKVGAFISAMTRLANQNLAEFTPSPVVEFLLYSHPSIGRRIAFARSFAQQNGLVNTVAQATGEVRGE